MKNMRYIIMIAMVTFLMMGCGEIERAEESTQLEEMIEETEVIVEEVDEDEDEDATPFGSFSATTTAGDEVTEEIFAAYDLTMVNIWATWCSPCVNEMDELQEVYAGLGDNINMITICYDGSWETKLANEILSENGAEFMAIIPDSEIIANIMVTIQYFPTTIFVDGEGNIVGERLEGAPSVNVVETYNAYIEDALAGL